MALFQKPLEERLQTSTQSKAHWLALVDIAVHDFTEVHGRIPTQLTITSFYQKANKPSTQSIPSLSCPQSLSRHSLSETTEHFASAYEGSSTWDHDENWNDPARDFDPLFKGGVP
eukprot:13399241-Ditylum_brightwellii.AAC.1